MKKIREFIKKYFVKIKNFILKNRLDKQNKEIKLNDVEITSINWELINNLSKYDLVLVKMDNMEIKKNNISEGHQKRPFLIRKNYSNEKKFNGYYCTSNINGNYVNDRYNELKLVLYKNNYVLHKSTLLLYDKEVSVDYENVIHWLDHLNCKDITKLKKYRTLIKGKMYISYGRDGLIEIGDVVHHLGINYLIYQVDNTKIYGYYIVKYEKDEQYLEDHRYILDGNNMYFIDYSRNVVFDKDDVLHVVNRFSEEFVNNVRKNKKILKSELKNKGKKKVRRKK